VPKRHQHRPALILGIVLAVGLAACAPADDEVENDGAAPSAITATAVDIDWKEKRLSASAGIVEVTLENQGRIPHTFVIEGHEGRLRLNARAGGTDSGTIELEAGEYVFYCDVPGHRAAGQEGTLTVS
jgi:plastocyanin